MLVVCCCRCLLFVGCSPFCLSVVCCGLLVVRCLIVLRCCVVVCRLVFVVRCSLLLFVVCCVLLDGFRWLVFGNVVGWLVVCCLMIVIRCVLFVVCCLVFVVCCLLFVV